MEQGPQQITMQFAEMARDCTSCGECVRPCAFLQQQGIPAAIAKRGESENNLLSAFDCSLCGLCDAVCPEGISPSTMFLAMRQEAIKRNLINLKPYRPWLNYEKLGSSILFKRDLIPSGSTTVFFPGCSLPGTRPDSVRELFTQLKQIEPTTGLVLDCCGKISHDLGMKDQFDAVFKRLSSRLQSKGITRIVTSCPGCSKILQKYGEAFDVVSAYELLSTELKTQTKEGKEQKTVVSIHDPCTARFDYTQQQAVRTLVQSCGYQIEELPEHGCSTRCCGQGGMVEGSVPGTIKRESRILAAEAGGRPVISSCAACCETLSPNTLTAHVADLLTGNTDFSTKPVSSAKRWLNRLKLRLARF